MYWKLHLSVKPLRHIAILPGEPIQIAVSAGKDKIGIYDLNTGAHYGDVPIDADLLDNDIPEERRAGLNSLRGFNGAVLPFVEFNASHLYTSDDGNLRLIHDLNAGLTLEMDDLVIPLDIPGNPVVTLTDLDRELGTVVAYTEESILYLFQQQTLISTLPQEGISLIKAFVISGGNQILLVQPELLRLMDTSGRVLRKQELHYNVGAAAMSPEGRWLALVDADHQLIRLYNRDLILVRQQHAVDVLARAQQLQLFGASTTPTAPISALALAEDGSMAFAVAGVLCVTHIDALTELPQPRLLL